MVKIISFIFLLSVSTNSFAGVISTRSNRYLYQKKNIQKLAPKKTEAKPKTIKVFKSNPVNKALLSENAALKKKLVEKKHKTSFDFTKSLSIPAGTILKGTLLNSIVTSNLKSPVSVRVLPNKYLISGATILCEGARSARRVFIACDRMIIEGDEYSGMVTSVLNLDGSNGVKGKYWSSEEQYVAGIAAASFATGVISASQQTLTTPYGEQIAQTGKNRVYGGLANTGNEITTIKA